MENACAICAKLDGRVFSRKQMEESDYQPGEVHLHCNCIWVRMTGSGKPSETDGLPDGIDELSYLVNTPKAELKKEGVLGDDETKAQVLRLEKYNNENNGETLGEVENSIRGQDFETLAVFDANGRKNRLY